MRGAYKRLHLTLNGIMFLFDGNLDILRLLNTKFIVSNLGLNSDLITEVFKNEAEVLYQFKHPLERVYCASDQVVNPEPFTIPGQLANLATTLDRPVIVDETIVEGELLTENCKVNELKVYTSKLEFNVDTDQATVVFIPTNYHPYWRAKINGENVNIHKANFSFMALKLEPGVSEVVMEFINSKLTVSAALLIMLGMISLYFGLTQVHSNWKKLIFILCGILLIGKNLMSVPGIMNTDIPEKPPIHLNNQSK